MILLDEMYHLINLRLFCRLVIYQCRNSPLGRRNNPRIMTKYPAEFPRLSLEHPSAIRSLYRYYFLQLLNKAKLIQTISCSLLTLERIIIYHSSFLCHLASIHKQKQRLWGFSNEINIFYINYK